MKIVKGAGHDWHVTYCWEDGEPEEMSVFGVMTAEEALREARFSLDASEADDSSWPGYEILSVIRADQREPAA